MTDPHNASWWAYLPVTRAEMRAVISHEIGEVWAYVLAQTSAVTTMLDNLEDRMTSMEDTQYDRARELLALVRAEFASLRAQIDAAVADKDAAIAAGVSSALAEDAQRDTERLSGLVDELASVLPGTIPDVPVPAPGEPAVLPETEGDTPA